jgi:hypothetical protein
VQNGLLTVQQIHDRRKQQRAEADHQHHRELELLEVRYQLSALSEMRYQLSALSFQQRYRLGRLKLIADS